MNTLSWMIYFAGAVGALKVVSGIALIFTGTGMVLAWVFKTFKPTGTIYSWDNKEACLAAADRRAEVAAASFKPLMRTVMLAAAILVAVPGQSTMYAIAASEIGERALNSATGGKAIQALNAWLDRQISGDGDETSAPREDRSAKR